MEIFFEGSQILWAFILNLLGLFLDLGHYWNKNIFGCMKTLFLLNDMQCTSIDEYHEGKQKIASSISNWSSGHLNMR